jgi:uncharacterized protein YbgA (DUF1722 family)/uncharacterized protein YbbK (DUF523 family)
MIRIGVSACLLGRKVRYDGQHKRDDFLMDTLAPHVEYVPVCPEVELGLGTPRPPIHLTREGGGPVRLVVVPTGQDLTAAMDRFAARRVEALMAEELSGYVLKKDSPSCGMERVKVHGGAQPRREGVGRFAAALLARFPHLPVEEEGRLRDARLRESFVERVFAYHRLRSLWAGRWTQGELVAFHTAHKLALLAHSPAAYQALGRLVARGKAAGRAALHEAYTAGFMAALEVPATRGRHANVLSHMAGYLRDGVDAASREELRGTIADYRAGLVPLIVPLTLMRHHARVQKIDYLLGQTYLDPHPKELMLRNHV